MLVGKVFRTSSSGDCKVIEYINSENITVEFIDTGFITSVRNENLNLGKIKDYLRPSVYGEGVLGLKYKSGEYDKYLLQLWKNMLKRCYSDIQCELQPTYKDCEVSDNFKNFDYFSEWCKKQTSYKMDGWELDKDILVKGNKLYSEDTCCFVPKEINLLLVNRQLDRGDCPVGVNYHKKRKQYRARCNKDGISVHLGWFSNPLDAFVKYRQTKEDHIKVIAEKWKHLIDPRVYTALMNYQVEITD